MPYTYEYPRPAVTADCVVMTRGESPRVLLIKRGNEPFKGHWAIPGGFMEMGETTLDCALRELQEETNLEVEEVTMIGVYDAIDRDPRHRTISLAYLALVEPEAMQHASAGDDAADHCWFPIDELPPLAFDHDQILADAKILYEALTRCHGATM